MMFKKITLCLIFLFFTGCESGKSNYIPEIKYGEYIYKITSNDSSINNYPPGEIHFVFKKKERVNENILKYEYNSFTPSIIHDRWRNIFIDHENNILYLGEKLSSSENYLLIKKPYEVGNMWDDKFYNYRIIDVGTYPFNSKDCKSIVVEMASKTDNHVWTIRYAESIGPIELILKTDTGGNQYQLLKRNKKSKYFGD